MRVFVLISFLIITQLLRAQTVSIQAINGSYARLTPTMGVNGNARYYCHTWNHQPLMDSAKKLNPSIIRYPAGLPGNDWDWQTGTVITTTAACTGTPPCAVVYKHDQLKIALDTCHSDMLYNLNTFKSTIAYQLQGINYANGLGIPIKYIELGNEQNLPGCQNTTNSTFTTVVKPFADSIKAHYPNCKISLVGGNTGPTGTAAAWVPAIASGSINFDAFSHHLYVDANNSDGLFYVNRALANSYSVAGMRYSVSSFSSMPTKDVWITEYNMNPVAIPSTNTNTLINTWTHVLFNNAILDTMLHYPKVKMMIPWALTDNTITINNGYHSIDPINFKLKATGIQTKLINDASRGLDSCRQIKFSSTQMQSYGGFNYPKIFGWEFYNANKSVLNSYLVNLSNTPYQLNISSIYPSQTVLYNQYKGDTAQAITNGFLNLNVTSGNITTTINIPAYSITVLKKSTSTSLHELIEAGLEMSVYPNPFNDEFNIELNSTDFEYYIYDNLGKEILKGKNNLKVNASQFPNGVYFLKVDDRSNNRTYFKKLIK